MSIEDVAHETPEKIFKLKVNPFTGPEVTDLMKAADHLGIPDQRSQLVWLMKSLYDCFMERDCDMVEINPRGETEIEENSSRAHATEASSICPYNTLPLSKMTWSYSAKPSIFDVIESSVSC